MDVLCDAGLLTFGRSRNYMSRMSPKLSEAGIEAAGYLTFIGLIVGVSVFLFNWQTVNGRLVIGACTAAGAAIGFILGYLYEQYRKPVTPIYYGPGNAPNIHPFQSHNWYQHEHLMEAERALADRARRLLNRLHFCALHAGDLALP